jgi:hypothetical protein
VNALIGSEFNSAIDWAKNFPLENARAIDRLAASLFVNCDEPGTQYMSQLTLFTAYFDASGDGRKHPFTIVSGYIANYLQWKMFEHAWEDIHKQFNVELPFHMAEFIAALEQPKYSLQSNARADYVTIAKDQEKAKEFLHQLAFIELTKVSCGISCIVNMNLYNEVDSVLDLQSVVPPYALGARMCIERVRQWQEYFNINKKYEVENIFESGDFGQGKFTELMVDEGQPEPIYKKKKDFAGLQGADHYAWEQFCFLRDTITKPDSLTQRWSFHMLLNAIPKLHTQPTLGILIDLCHRKGIKVRERT